MPKARLRICAEPGCPEYTERSRCTEHRRQRERSRGTRQQRGYDAAYDAERARVAPAVAAGRVTCWRCHQRILLGERWTLGHDDRDRSIIRGPEHEHCGLSAAGKAAHGISPGA